MAASEANIKSNFTFNCNKSDDDGKREANKKSTSLHSLSLNPQLISLAVISEVVAILG